MVAKWIPLLLLGVLVWSAAATSDDDVGNANDYMDSVLDNLKKEPEVAEHLDPLSVPDYGEDNYNLRNIKVRGLSNMYRSGDCTLSYKNSTVNVVVEIAVKDVTVTLDYSAKALFFWVHGDGLLSVDHIAIKLDVLSTGGKARVKSLKVVNLGDYSVKRMTGLSFMLNWLLKIIANNAIRNARGNIISALENGGKEALDNVLSQYELPIY